MTKKVALYSSGRPRKPAVPEDAPEAAAPDPAPLQPAAASTPPGRLRRFYRRHERPLLLAAGALFAVALVATYAHTRPAPREVTQKDIDAAVLHTLENNALPSMAAKAFAAIEPSVVKVTGYGVVKPDDLKDESEPAKGARKGERAKESAGKGGTLPKGGAERLGRNDEGRSKDGDKPSDKPAERGGFHSFPDKDKDKDKDKQAAKDDPFDHNDKGEKLHSTGIGTGVVIVDKGVILTNLHVVAGAEKIKVRFFEGTEAEAVVIGARPEHDLAVLQAKSIPDDLQAATLRSTADLQVGDQVVAVGFPFGIGPSATAGVVSGLKREYHSPEGKRILTNLIQFDAAANPGNSGGPLITADGEVVGIVTGILNPTSQRVFIGIGFAVPIENAAAAVGMSPF
ncbi:MAG: trypsin-like peptidase domain-containing protein [Burkholderiales bacterium]